MQAPLLALAISLLVVPRGEGDQKAEETREELEVVEESIVVTGQRLETTLEDLPAAASVLKERTLSLERSTASLPEVLEGVPGVMVQKTTRGFGSPFLRGWTGFRTLTLVDGIRLNNSTYREGPNQYTGLVSAFGLERIEVIRGPGSVPFGSDAIGGVLQVVPRAARNSGFELLYRGASAERSSHLFGSISLRSDRWRGIAGGVLGDFGDLEGGPQVGRNLGSDYSQSAGFALFDRPLGGRGSLRLGIRLTSLEDVPRVHRTTRSIPWRGTRAGADLDRRFDLARTLVYGRLRWDPEHPLSERVRLTLSHQTVDEERLRIRGSGSRDRSGFEVSTFGLDLQSSKTVGPALVTYGVEIYRDGVDSFRRVVDERDRVLSEAIQGPIGDDASYLSAGVYTQARIEVGRRNELFAGLRWSRAEANADRVEDPTTGRPFRVDDSWSAAVGELRWRRRLTAEWSLFAAVSQGFRAPNLSDLTTFELTEARYQEVPAPALDPERFLSTEIGLSARTETWSSGISVFSTHIDGLIDRFWSGLTTAAGDLLIFKDNVGDGRIDGWEVEGDARLTETWSLHLWGFETRGDLETFIAEVDAHGSPSLQLREVPLSRIAPLTGGATLRWQSRRGRRRGLWAEAGIVAASRQDRLSPRDRLDDTRIPPGGTPGYTVATLRAGLEFRPGLEAALRLENVTDEDYRIHGSGINEPGRSLVLVLRWRREPSG